GRKKAKPRRSPKRKGDTCWLCKDEPVLIKKHGLGARCYSSARNWSANKTEEQRAEYLKQLILRQSRLRALSDGLVRIEHLKETADDQSKKPRAKSKSSGRLHVDRGGLASNRVH